MMHATFPKALIQDMRFRFVGQSLDTQESLSGEVTAPASHRGRWTAQLSFVLRGEGSTLAWQAFIAQMDGRTGRTVVPVITRFRPYDRDGHGIIACKKASLADAQTWEHFNFVNSDVATVSTVEAAPLRGIRIKVAKGNTTGIRPGQYMSFGERLYRVQLHWTDNNGVTNLQIQPPLREALPIGAVAVIDRPVCAMRFATDDEGADWDLLNRLPVVNVNMIEAR